MARIISEYTSNGSWRKGLFQFSKTQLSTESLRLIYFIGVFERLEYEERYKSIAILRELNPVLK